VSSAGTPTSSCIPEEKNEVDEGQVTLVTMHVEFATNPAITKPGN
jgi:hypothetical protein